MTAPTREQVAQALVDDAWEGHEGPLTVADLEAIADALMPMIQTGQAEAWDEGYDAGDRTARAVNPEWPNVTLNPYRLQEDQ